MNDHAIWNFYPLYPQGLGHACTQVRVLDGTNELIFLGRSYPKRLLLGPGQQEKYRVVGLPMRITVFRNLTGRIFRNLFHHSVV